MCNHMETASHPSFIKPFIAFIAEGALLYELLKNLAVHMYVPQPHSIQLCWRRWWDSTNDLYRAIWPLLCEEYERVICFLFCFCGSAQMGLHFAREQLVEVNDARAAGLLLHCGDTNQYPVFIPVSSVKSVVKLWGKTYVYGINEI